MRPAPASRLFHPSPSLHKAVRQPAVRPSASSGHQPHREEDLLPQAGTTARPLPGQQGAGAEVELPPLADEQGLQRRGSEPLLQQEGEAAPLLAAEATWLEWRQWRTRMGQVQPELVAIALGEWLQGMPLVERSMSSGSAR